MPVDDRAERPPAIAGRGDEVLIAWPRLSCTSGDHPGRHQRLDIPLPVFSTRPRRWSGPIDRLSRASFGDLRSTVLLSTRLPTP